MATAKKYFYDHFVLLLLTINAFLSVAAIISITIRLATAHRNSYFIQYRPSLGTNAYQTGGVKELISFSLFAALILGINIALSYKAYKIHRQLAIIILALGILLLALTLIIS